MITYPNLYHLKYFSDAVELGSISGSAQKNLVTHPAISRAISSLEKHLGISLLEHQKKSFKVTEAGYRIAEQAEILLAAASGFKKLSLTSEKNEALELRIGISRTLAETYLSSLLLDLKTTFPHATAKVRFGTTNEIIEAVANRSVDLGITIGTLPMATLNQTQIQKGKFLLVEAGSKKEGEQNFAAKSFLITEPRMETEKLKTAYQKQFARPLPVLFEISSWDVIGHLTKKGIGVGLLPDLTVHNWKKSEFRILKNSWFDCSYEVYVHSLKTSVPHRAIAHAKDLLANRR